MKVLLVLLAFAICFGNATAKEEEKKEEFIIEKEVKHTPVISQGRTGTCWSFATTSFLESEIMRLGYPETNLSEMFFVHYNYQNKALQYLYYHGNNNYGEGSLSHDVIKILEEKGMASYESFPGEKKDGKYNHTELVKELKAEAKAINAKKKGKFNTADLKKYKPILKKELGKMPQNISCENGESTPLEYRDKFGINADDYVELTSYSHHPFYKTFVLEIPDNWAHAAYYNLPVDELMEEMFNAINNGYSIAWDGDCSEKGFSHKKGKADVEKKQMGKVDQEMRQATFNDRTTTDDHLMHLVGLSKDADGKPCFYTKNSWGKESNPYGGYLHMTEDYVRLKTVGILVHKDAIPTSIKTKLGL